MAHKHLHELLKEDQEPFQLKHYITDKRIQLKRLNNNNNISPSSKTTSILQTVAKKHKPITKTTSFSKHACFLSFQESPDVRKSPLNFPSPVVPKSPTRKVFLHIPSSTSTILLEAAMRIQNKQNSKPKNQINKVGFGLFGSILKKLKNKKREIKNTTSMHKTSRIYAGSMEGLHAERHNNENIQEQNGMSCSCNNSRLSSAGWSESNNEEEISIDFDESSVSSCSRSHTEEIEEIIDAGDFIRFCSSPISPFRFSLQKCSSSNGRRTPDFSSPAASPVRHMKEDKETYEAQGLADIEEEEKEQCSPVSVLDPRFDDDDGHEGEDEDEEDDECDHECSYALVQRAQQQLLYKLRRFEKLAELDPIELEKLMLDEEGNGDLEELDEFQDDDDDSVLSYRDRDFETFASEVTIPFDMKRLVSDLISEEKTETNILNNREVVFGRVCKKLDSWLHVRSDTIDMMVESDLKTEFDDWKKFHEQREETAMEIELSIFRLLVEELAEELA